MKTIALSIVSILVVIVGYFLILELLGQSLFRESPIDPTPISMTLVGTFMCLPHLDMSGPQTEECAFGIQADTGEFYAVNFGQSADAMGHFQARARIRAEGFFVPKEALSTDHWNKYDMQGIFTVTQLLDVEIPAVESKIDIYAVCEGALAYMTFTDGEAAARFIEDCKEGKKPEVIEQWKQQMGIENLQVI